MSPAGFRTHDRGIAQQLKYSSPLSICQRKEVKVVRKIRIKLERPQSNNSYARDPPNLEVKGSENHFAGWFIRNLKEDLP